MRVPVIIVILLLGLLTGAAAADVIIRVYDVRDLLYTPKDFPAPKLGLHGLDEESGDPFRDEDDLNGPIISAEELVELIKTHIQPDRWEQAGNSVRVHNGQLIVVAEMETHQEVSASLLQWRIDGAPNTYAINARVIPSDLALLTALGFDGKSKRNSRAIDAKRLSNALAGRTANAHEFPQLSMLEGQTSHVLRVTQSAYVADAKRNEETGIVEKKIEVLNEGWKRRSASAVWSGCSSPGRLKSRGRRDPSSRKSTEPMWNFRSWQSPRCTDASLSSTAEPSRSVVCHIPMARPRATTSG